MSKVSVVITNYNYGRFLERRLRSVLEQTYRDFEVIYLDDCSTDNSEEVLAQFLNDPRIRVVRNTVNGGSAFKQLNKGARLTQGEYLWVAEADDYTKTDFLETMVPVLDAHPSVGLAYCQSLAVDEHDTVLGSMTEYTDELDPERWKHDYVNDGRDECRRYLLFKNTIPNTSAVLFRRKTLEEAGYADETLTLASDHLTYVNMLLISDIAFVARPLNYFRHHTGTVRQRSKREGLPIKEEYQILAHIRDKLGLSEKEVDAAYTYLVNSRLRKLFRLRKRIPLRTAVKIYRLARAIDPQVNARLVRYFFAGWTRPLSR